MSGEQFRRLGVELDFLVYPDVNLCEVVLVEVGLKYFSVDKYILVFQFLLCAENKPCGINLLVLVVYGLCLVLAFTLTD